MTSLSILDLAPIPSGATAGDALRNTLDLARRAEEFGYHRYWVAEHHFASGVASAAPAVLIGLVAAATSTIRVGSGAVQLGHQTALAVVEQFGLIDALYPGRIDLGLGRSGQCRTELAELAKKTPPQPLPARVVDGLLIPEGFSSPRTVAEKLRVLRDVTGADELLVTTITHDHADRVRSFELLAAEWAGSAAR